MTSYDFTSLPNRLGHHAVKWQAVEKSPDLLPLWVADMDFVTFPEMKAALHDYVEQAVYGYTYTSEGVIQAIMDWEATQHGYHFDRQALVLIEGVVPAISTAIQALTAEGDAVLINTPVYPPFARSVKLNKRRLVSNSLVQGTEGFELDLVQLEKDIVAHEVKLYVLCNPHNPGGRVWITAELMAIGQLCQKHGVLLVSDEIHQDLTLFGHIHHSFNTVSPDFKAFSLILSSATKTFNIAGTKNSFVIIENPQLREAFQRQQLANNQHEIPSIGLISTQVAFEQGKAWLAALKPVLEGNINYLVSELRSKTRIHVMKPQGTYLVWLDFSAYGLEHQALLNKVRQEARLILNDGLTFGSEGHLHLRINVAAPRHVIVAACERLIAAFG